MSAVFAKYYKLYAKFLVDYNEEIKTKLKDALNLDEQQCETVNDALKVDDIVNIKKLTRRGGAKSGTTRAPTAYNIFVQQKIKELKTKFPDMDRKKLMVEAASAWTAEKERVRKESDGGSTTTSPRSKKAKK